MSVVPYSLPRAGEDWGTVMEVFRGSTADEVWCQAHEALVLATLSQRHQPSRAGDTVELLGVALEVSDPLQRWITSRRPAISPAFGIAEVLWILAGSNDAKVLNYWFPRLPEFAGTGSEYPGAYGYRLRKQFGVDQIRRACEVLAANPASRQAVLQLWDPRVDLPNQDGSPRNADVPCNITSLLKVRDGRLEWTQIMRSNDLLRGLPYNFLQFTFLQEMMAGWLGIKVGCYRHWSDSLHIYAKDAAQFSCVSDQAVPRNTDSLAMDFNTGDLLIRDLYDRTEELAVSALNEERVAALSALPGAPVGYQNLLRVLGAEAARRQARPEQSDALMADCTNPQLVQAWSAWRGRRANVERG